MEEEFDDPPGTPETLEIAGLDRLVGIDGLPEEAVTPPGAEEVAAEADEPAEVDPPDEETVNCWD